MALPEAVLAGLIGAAGSVAGAGIGAAGTAIANRKSFQYSRKYFDYQNWYNQTYYSPAMQMARFRQAGLNPHLVSGDLNSSVGSMTGQYQNPIDGNALPNALLTAFNMYQQQKSLDNQTSSVDADVALKRANAAKASADSARINYYNSMIQPWEAVSAQHKSDILKYGVGRAHLLNQKLLQDISLFSMQKQKYQLGLDLLEIEKKYADEYHKARNSSVKADAALKHAESGIRSLDLHNYQTYGLRPQDPYYLRIGSNAMENFAKRSSFGSKIYKFFFGD
jgi:hypothetical protein